MSEYSFMDSPHKRWKLPTTGVSADNVCERNNDLISRSELKKTMYVQFSTSSYFNHMIDVIDSAPTVENISCFCENASKEELEDFKMGLRKVIRKPQDEWIYLPSTKEYKCPKCENTCKCMTFRYCPWCGSDNLGDDE